MNATARRVWLCATLACLSWLFASATRAAPVPAEQRATSAPDERARRQVLLMLRLAPAHYRPDAYGGDYNAAGRVARRHTAERLAREQGLVLHDAWAMPAIGVDCFVLDAPDRAAALRAAQALALDPRVESAQPMQLFRLLGDRAARDDPLYAIQPAAAAWHLSELHGQATGKGVRVAVIDSGVALDHPDLRGQVAMSRDFVGDHGTAGEAHGTAVAGIIAARAGNGVGIVGVAPQARLLALRACWQTDASAASCSSFTLAQALQFAITSRADVLNLSLSGPSDRLLGRLLDAAVAHDIDVVGAVDAAAPDGGFPASHPGVIAVDDLGAPPRTRAARTWQAPGTGIPAPLPDGGWGLVSGASFATAQVSGLVALLRQLRPHRVGDRLAIPGGPGVPRLVTPRASPVGLPLALERPRAIDACAVMRRSAGRCICACGAVSTSR